MESSTSSGGGVVCMDARLIGMLRNALGTCTRSILIHANGSTIQRNEPPDDATASILTPCVRIFFWLGFQAGNHHLEDTLGSCFALGAGLDH
jgi:hypothetical protein